jgi:hypothetical protein
MGGAFSIEKQRKADMSLANGDRKIRSISGRTIHCGSGGRLGAGRFAQEISAALRLDYGNTHAAVKVIVGLTGANKRTAKNWLEARNGPNGEALVDLCRHSDQVLATVLALAGRERILRIKALADARSQLREILLILDRLDDQ